MTTALPDVSAIDRLVKPVDQADHSEQAPARAVAYIMSRFPKLTETFILYEILALERHGVPVEIFPLLRERQQVSHPEALRLTERARFQPFISLRILAAQWRFIRRDARAYFRLWADVLKGTLGSLNFFVGALGILPKTVLFALEMERLNIRHVHAHFATHPALAAFIINRLTGIPYSFTAHGSDLHVERRMLDKKIQSAAFAVTISRYNKEVMVAECGEEARGKIHVVHCGVDTAFFQPPAMKSESGSFSILCVGSFEEVKGHIYLVEACRLLSAMGAAYECHLIGEGPQRRRIEKQIRTSGLRDRVRLHGGVPRAEVLRTLACADVLVLASVPTRQGKREGIPVALMEAMASGLPVVASNLSGIPELVQDGVTGILVPPRDSEELALALKRLGADSALRSRMGRAGRRQILAEFDLEQNALRLLELIGRRGA